MARRPARSGKYSRSPRRSQAEKERAAVREEMRRYRAAIKNAHKRLRDINAAEKKKKTASRSRKTAIPKFIENQAAQLNKLVSLGFYSPKKPLPKNQSKLTASQKKTAKRLMDKFGAFLTTEFKAIRPKTKDKKKTAKILDKAKQAGLHVSSKAVFIPRENITKAEIAFNKETGFEIIAERTIKKTGAVETLHIPFASIDEMEAKRKALKKRFDQLTRRLKKDETIRFYIRDKWGSNKTFQGSEFGLMWANISQYRATLTGRYEFVNQLTLGITRYPENQHLVLTHGQKSRWSKKRQQEWRKQKPKKRRI